MRGPFTRFINLPRLLVLAGFIMLGIGFGMLYGGYTDREPGTAAPESAYIEPVSGVLSEVDNPVSGPTSEPEAGKPQSLDWAPIGSVDLLPTRVRIPSIAVDSGVIDLRLNADRTLEVPEDVAVTGWYTGRSVPGEAGPSVIVGHVDSAIAGAGVFYNLRRLEPGDLIEIERSDGSVAEFLVTSLELAQKDQFPTEQVYGSTQQPTLRLITCGGSFDQHAGSYLGNVIVYAHHVGNRRAPLSKS